MPCRRRKGGGGQVCRRQIDEHRALTRHAVLAQFQALTWSVPAVVQNHRHQEELWEDATLPVKLIQRLFHFGLPGGKRDQRSIHFKTDGRFSYG